MSRFSSYCLLWWCCDVTYPTPLTSSLHSKPPTAALNMNSSFDPQRQCKLFAAPTEIRFAIYAYLILDRMHLSLREKGFRLSSCVQRDRDGDHYCIHRRSIDANNNPRDTNRDPIYARRVESKWSEHWRCEEAAIEMDGDCNTNCDNTLMALLSVCKQMSVNDTLCQGSCPADHHCRFTDVAEAIADTVAIEINDCDTLGSLVSNSGPEVPAQSCTSSLFRCVLPNLKELGISLRPPLAAYEEFEYADDSISSTSPFASAWIALPSAIEHMSRLKRFRIWLDHEEPCSWSMVNERAVLSPLASLSNNPDLSVSINLPKLHPKWETADRHFTKDSAPLPLPIQRRYRQKYRGVQQANGSFRVQEVFDFPVLDFFTVLLEITMEEVEEMERDMWERGQDPMQELRDMDQMSNFPNQSI
jgi:hypothetical protein